MKKIILLIITAILLVCDASAQMVEIVPDSIVSSFDIRNQGLFQVYHKDTLYSQHTRKDKADAMAFNIMYKYNTDEVKVVSPISIPESSMEIYIDRNKLTNTVQLDTTTIALVKHLQSVIDFQGQVINDVYTVEIPLINERIRYVDSLHYKKIERLENRINTLQTFIRDSIQFTDLKPEPINLVKEPDSVMPSWNVVYRFLPNELDWVQDLEYDASEDYKYITFFLKEHLIVGETYKITFDLEVESETQASRIDFWGYVSPISNPDVYVGNPTIVTTEFYYDGSYEREFTVELRDRDRVGIRAMNGGNASAFVITNFKIIKL